MAPPEETCRLEPLIFRRSLPAWALRTAILGMGARVRRQFTLTLPGSNSRAIWALALFVAVQCADAIQTFSGMSRFGTGIEANPLLAFYAATFGPSTALVGAKAVAIIGGATLHVLSQHFILAVLTVGCVFGAIVPWSLVLNAVTLP